MNEAGVSLVLPQTGFAGHIHLARHGEPDLPRSDWLSRDGFNAWWEEYERVGLLASGSPPRLLQEIAERAAVIVTSHIPRARATAERIAGDCDIIVDEIYQEAPLPAPLLVPFLRATPPI